MYFNARNSRRPSPHQTPPRPPRTHVRLRPHRTPPTSPSRPSTQHPPPPPHHPRTTPQPPKHHPQRPKLPRTRISRANKQQPADGKDSELITLALNTLGGFDFTGNVLNEFVRDVMINYVEDDNPEVRK